MSERTPITDDLWRSLDAGLLPLSDPAIIMLEHARTLETSNARLAGENERYRWLRDEGPEGGEADDAPENILAWNRRAPAAPPAEEVMAILALKRLNLAIAALGKIKNGKTLFELRPTNDEETLDAWLELSTAQKIAKQIIEVRARLTASVGGEG